MAVGTSSSPGPAGDQAALPHRGRPRTGRLLGSVTWPRLSWYQEVLAVILGDVFYEVVSASAPQHATKAFHNATLLTALEPMGVRSAETWLRGLTTAHPALDTVFNAYYALLHLTMTAGVLVWLWWRRPERYARARTALFALTLGALLVFWVFPVAPPRLVTPAAISALGAPGMAAVAAAGSSGGAVGLLVNPYAAFPSLHVAWAAWCAWAIWAHLGNRFRWLAWLYPLATIIVVVGTSNHYFIDVLAGLLLVLLTVIG
jgi:PAP2 superfamily